MTARDYMFQRVCYFSAQYEGLNCRSIIYHAADAFRQTQQHNSTEHEIAIQVKMNQYMGFLQSAQDYFYSN